MKNLKFLKYTLQNCEKQQNCKVSLVPIIE
jgi:hypothetical protein